MIILNALMMMKVYIDKSTCVVIQGIIGIHIVFL
jgi:hypothetical protein